MVVRPQPDWSPSLGPGGAADRADRQWSELVEGKGAVTLVFQQPLDPLVQLLLFERIGGLLPRLGALEGDAFGVEDLTQPFTSDAHFAATFGGEEVGELAQGPGRERVAQVGRSSSGRGDDQRSVSRRDPVGTATRPPRVQ